MAIDINDEFASKINDIEDIEIHKPGLLKATFEWFRNYKIPDGKPPNAFAFNSTAKNREFAINTGMYLLNKSYYLKQTIS